MHRSSIDTSYKTGLNKKFNLSKDLSKYSRVSWQQKKRQMDRFGYSQASDRDSVFQDSTLDPDGVSRQYDWGFDKLKCSHRKVQPGPDWQHRPIYKHF